MDIHTITLSFRTHSTQDQTNLESLVFFSENFFGKQSPFQSDDSTFRFWKIFFQNFTLFPKYRKIIAGDFRAKDISNFKKGPSSDNFSKFFDFKVHRKSQNFCGKKKAHRKVHRISVTWPNLCEALWTFCELFFFLWKFPQNYFFFCGNFIFSGKFPLVIPMDPLWNFFINFTNWQTDFCHVLPGPGSRK